MQFDYIFIPEDVLTVYKAWRERFMTIPEAARYLGFCERHIRDRFVSEDRYGLGTASMKVGRDIYIYKPAIERIKKHYEGFNNTE